MTAPEPSTSIIHPTRPTGQSQSHGLGLGTRENAQEGPSEARAARSGTLGHMSNANGWGGKRATRLRAWMAHEMRATQARGQHVICPRCQLPILPGEQWDTGHVLPITARPDLMWTPSNVRAEHARCNRADGAAITNARPHDSGAWRW